MRLIQQLLEKCLKNRAALNNQELLVCIANIRIKSKCYNPTAVCN